MKEENFFVVVVLGVIVLMIFNNNVVDDGVVVYAPVVLMNESVAEVLNDKYLSEENEFLFCVYGSITEDGLVVSELKETGVIHTDRMSIITEPCPNSRFDYLLGRPYLLGTIHSHPMIKHVPSCGLSDPDIFAFGYDRSVTTGVMCGENRFAFYSSEDFDSPLVTLIVGDVE